MEGHSGGNCECIGVFSSLAGGMGWVNEVKYLLTDKT